MLSLLLLLFAVVAVVAVAAVVAVVAVCSFFWCCFSCCCLGPHEPSWGALMSPHGGPKLGPIMGGAQVWALMGPWGAQTWAHHGRGLSLGPHGPMGGPNLGPSWAGLKFRASWAHGGPKLGPIMGGAQVWAVMGP
jgi:hypothetical protein